MIISVCIVFVELRCLWFGLVSFGFVFGGDAGVFRCVCFLGLLFIVFNYLNGCLAIGCLVLICCCSFWVCLLIFDFVTCL